MVDCIIQARMGSTRFPKKVLQNIKPKKTILEFLIDQLKYSKKIERIIIATTLLDEDNEIERMCKKIGIKCFRGDSKNVLDRYYKCAKHFETKNIMRITSDCPLIDPELIDEGIKKFDEGKFDYVENSQGQFPHGLDYCIFRFNQLEDAWKNAKLPSEKEHVIPYILKNIDQKKYFNFQSEKDYSKIRITLDYPEDLELLQEVVLHINSEPIKFEDIITLFKKNPNLLEINSGHKKDEGYLKSLEEDKKMLEKTDVNE
ncbi:MAG: acylneuraminate cytidylyltransferase [Dehalococcoidaceae bacterium]|nr:acylneuraminate cytidylyltransferase [Dehalococcoidaceae bacterium]|tara:strand:+ start:491 stop:1264 length:774 start_codon:yes stop_codon:yes gene_type:complete